jgi:hypothetical protein
MIMGYVFPPSICQMLRDTEEPTHWSKKLTKTKTKVETTPLPASSAGKRVNKSAVSPCLNLQGLTAPIGAS